VVLVVLALILLVPVVEIFAAVQVSHVVGVLPTLLLLVLVSLLGAWIVRHQGLQVWRRVGEQLAAGRVPTAELVDGFIVLVAGVLLVVPGFVTGVVGAVLVLPPVRHIAAAGARRRYGRRVIRVTSTGPLRSVYDVDGTEGPMRPRRGELGP